MSDNAFVHVRDLRVVFRRDGQTINAVNGVSFEVQKGEVMALIGESGSGKSVTLRALMRLHPPGSSELSGTLRVGDDAVLTMSASQLRRYRGGRCAMIFQEPLLAFDPVYTVGQQIIEGLPQTILAARYHSLIIDKYSKPECLEVIATTNDGEIMAVKHCDYDIYGVQFHPESIMTPDGLSILKNFLAI